MKCVKRTMKGTVFNTSILGSGQVIAFDGIDCATPLDDLHGQEVWFTIQNYNPELDNQKLVVESKCEEKDCLFCTNYSYIPETQYEPREDYCRATDDDFDECIKNGYKYYERRKNINYD